VDDLWGCEMAPIEVRDVPKLPGRRADSHKGNYGRILVVAGSQGMSGAAALAGAAALRGGAGLVRVVCPRTVWPLVAGYEPSYLTWPLPETPDGCLATDGVPEVIRLAEENDYVVLGPGMGQGAFPAIRELIPRIRKPLVLDADGLNALAGGHLELLRQREAATIITPHPGEFSRIVDRPVAEIQAMREELAREFAELFGLVVVLKGYRTVVTDGTRVYVNSTGNPGMATGGCGDVLTGLLAAFWAQLNDPLDAAIAAVYVHGLAGDHAALELTQESLIASDLLAFVSDAIRELQAD